MFVLANPEMMLWGWMLLEWDAREHARNQNRMWERMLPRIELSQECVELLSHFDSALSSQECPQIWVQSSALAWSLLTFSYHLELLRRASLDFGSEF